MLKNKFTFLSVIVIICALGALIILVFYLLREQKKEINTTQPDFKEQTLEQANQEAVKLGQAKKAKSVRPIDKTDHVWGNLGAAVQLIIYDDFACPFCLEFYNTTEQIKQEFGDKIVIAFRHYPLNIHPTAIPAAEASECAAEQGKFWEMYHKLFADSKIGQLNKEKYKKDALEIGLDTAQFSECLEAEKYKDKVLTQMLEGKNIGITGTPTSFINQEPLPGAYPLEDFIDSQGRERQGMRSVINKQLVNRKQ